uniref:choice-of-anchor J domain-containing protein n=1 Tax=uncultured Chryseobacterium sp. TaxID=259322 RepID=UPI00260D0EE5
LPTIYSEAFAAGGFGPGSDWTAVSVTGAQAWNTSNQGNGSNYYAVMNGFASGNQNNEDWLISKAVSLVGKSQAVVNFTTDVRYAGNALQVYATDNYTGNPATTTWTQLSPVLDTNINAFGDWVSSGNVSLNAFLGKDVRIAFKYTSTTSAAATWEVDDFKIKAQ